MIVAFNPAVAGGVADRDVVRHRRLRRRPVHVRLVLAADRVLRASRQWRVRCPDQGTDRGSLAGGAPMRSSLLLALLAPASAIAGPAIEATEKQAHQLARHRHVLRLRGLTHGHHLLGGQPHQVHGRLLHRRRRHHRLPERPGDRRRLHVGGHAARSDRDDLHPGLRRLHLHDRLLRRLADHPLPDGRTPAQPGPLHLRRHHLLPPRPGQGAHHGGDLAR